MIKRLFRVIRQEGFLTTLNFLEDAFRQYVISKISTFWFILRYRMIGGHPGKGLYVYGHVILRSPRGRIFIGDRVQMISSSWRSSSSALDHPVRLRTFSSGAEIILEDGCGLNGTSITCRSTKVRIGKEVMIAPNVTITDSNFHNPWPPEARAQFSGKQDDAPVEIGPNVWIGMNVIILKGVVIGQNSVIAAGSVVVKSIPQNCLAAGNPARIVKHYLEE